MASTINADTTNGVVVTSDTSGEIELQSAGVTKAKVTANGLQDANGNSLRGGMYRNLIINGDMRIDQRNAGGAVTAGNAYPVDRWYISNTANGSYSAQQVSDTPVGFSSSLKVTVTAAQTANIGNLAPVQIIEGNNISHLDWGTSDAKSVTLSFWVRSSLTGTFGGSLRNSSSNRSYPFTYTISVADTWEYKTITIAGDTSGTWLTTNGVGIRVRFSLYAVASSLQSAGTWYAGSATGATGQTQLASTNGATFYITGVQLEVGEGASDFEFLPYDVQLARCQRYFERMAGAVNVPYSSGSATYANQPRTVLFYKTQKRAVPTLSSSAASEFRFQFSSSVNTPSAISLASIGVDTAFLNASGITISADTPCILISNSSSSYLDFSSEL